MHQHSLVVVYYCRTYEKAVSGGGEREKGLCDDAVRAAALMPDGIVPILESHDTVVLGVEKGHKAETVSKSSVRVIQCTWGDIKEETLRGRQASPDREEKRDGVAGSQVTKLGGDWSGMGFSKDQLYATTCLKTWDGMVQTMATLYTAWSKPCLY